MNAEKRIKLRIAETIFSILALAGFWATIAFQGRSLEVYMHMLDFKDFLGEPAECYWELYLPVSFFFLATVWLLVTSDWFLFPNPADGGFLRYLPLGTGISFIVSFAFMTLIFFRNISNRPIVYLCDPFVWTALSSMVLFGSCGYCLIRLNIVRNLYTAYAFAALPFLLFMLTGFYIFGILIPFLLKIHFILPYFFTDKNISFIPPLIFVVILIILTISLRRHKTTLIYGLIALGMVGCAVFSFLNLARIYIFHCMCVLWLEPYKAQITFLFRFIVAVFTTIWAVILVLQVMRRIRLSRRNKNTTYEVEIIDWSPRLKTVEGILTFLMLIGFGFAIAMAGFFLDISIHTAVGGGEYATLFFGNFSLVPLTLTILSLITIFVLAFSDKRLFPQSPHAKFMRYMVFGTGAIFLFYCVITIYLFVFFLANYMPDPEAGYPYIFLPCGVIITLAGGGLFLLRLHFKKTMFYASMFAFFSILMCLLTFRYLKSFLLPSSLYFFITPTDLFLYDKYILPGLFACFIISLILTIQSKRHPLLTQMALLALGMWIYSFTFTLALMAVYPLTPLCVFSGVGYDDTELKLSIIFDSFYNHMDSDYCFAENQTRQDSNTRRT